MKIQLKEITIKELSDGYGFKGDRRGGSNSAFFAHAILTIERLIELVRQQWPELADRIPPIERFTTV